MLIDCDEKIICHAEFARTKFKYFEGSENYRNEILLSKFGISTRCRLFKMGIEVGYRKVLILEFGIEK